MSAFNKSHNPENHGHVDLVVTMAAVYDRGAILYWSGDSAVTINAATDQKAIAGECKVPATAAGGLGTLATPFRAVIDDAVGDAVIAVGKDVKTAVDVAGQQLFSEWLPASDTADERYGRVIEACAGAGETFKLGVF
jgi:hypothetical protein